MEILNDVAAKFLSSLKGQGKGDGLNLQTVLPALAQLLTGPDGKLDLAGIVERLKSQGLGMLVQSWLGDGENSAISLDAVRQLFGGDKVQAFASSVGIGEPEATQGLADAVPQLLDKASSGGSLLEAFGGAGSALGALSKLF